MQEEKLNFKPESFSQKLQKYCEPNTETFKYVFLSDLSAQTEDEQETQACLMERSGVIAGQPQSERLHRSLHHSQIRLGWLWAVAPPAGEAWGATLVHLLGHCGVNKLEYGPLASLKNKGSPNTCRVKNVDIYIRVSRLTNR